MAIKVKFQLLTCHGAKLRTLLLPGHNIVCDRCGGNGKHVNPAVDACGITPEEFDRDPDFAESYFNGTYDVTCEKCAGDRVVGVVSTEKLPKALRKRVAAQIEYEVWERGERAYERSMAAAGIEW